MKKDDKNKFKNPKQKQQQPHRIKTAVIFRYNFLANKQPAPAPPYPIRLTQGVKPWHLGGLQ